MRSTTTAGTLAHPAVGRDRNTNLLRKLNFKNATSNRLFFKLFSTSIDFKFWFWFFFVTATHICRSAFPTMAPTSHDDYLENRDRSPAKCFSTEPFRTKSLTEDFPTRDGPTCDNFANSREKCSERNYCTWMFYECACSIAECDRLEDGDDDDQVLIFIHQ